MNDKIDGSMGRRSPRGLRQFFHQINQMANSPWGSGPGKGEDDGGKGGGGDGKKPGPRNPWVTPDPADQRRAQKPRGPSALDELLRKGRGGFGGGGSGGGGSGLNLPESARLWKWGLLAAVVIWIGFSSIKIIGEGQAGVVTTLGSYSRTMAPGINFKLPDPLERVQIEDVQSIRELKIGATSNESQNFVLTQDQNIINLGYEVRWRVRDPHQYLFQIADQENTIREVAESAMRATVANYTLTDAIGPRRASIESEVRTRMQQLLDKYRAGVTIEAIQLQRAVQPEQVTDAFNKVTAAQQERESNINDAEAYASTVLERARGDASAFDKIYEQYKLAPEVTKRRLYYETMEQVLAPVDKVIVESGGVTPYLPLPELRRRAAEAPVTVESGR
ncbi:FtsH protease activity modulator HflK [Sphingopyxis fribergensis]